MTTTATAVNEVTSRVERERARKRRYQYRIKYTLSACGHVRAFVPEVGPYGTGVGRFETNERFAPRFFPIVFTHESSTIGAPCDRPEGCASYHSILDEIVRVNKLKGTYKKDDREIYEVPAGATFEGFYRDTKSVWVVFNGRDGKARQCNLFDSTTSAPRDMAVSMPYEHQPVTHPAITKEEAEKRLGRRIVFVNGGDR